MTDAMTVGQALDHAAGRLGEAGIGNVRLEARVLMGHALDAPPPAAVLEPMRRMRPPEWDRFREALGARCRRRPMAQITGRREFWSLELAVTPDTLIPRPDSETLVEAALAAFPRSDKALRVLDLGTGSGCLLLAILSERPRAVGLGVDIDPAALAVAAGNASRLGFSHRARFIAGNWAAGLTGPFDLVVANPPYIGSAEIAALDPEVAAFEPRHALDGGRDGLDSYRVIAPDLVRLIRAGGRAILEVGSGRAESVSAIMGKQGLEIESIRRDLCGVERCLVLRTARLNAC